MLGEKELISGCAKGERAAQRELYDRHCRRLMAVCLRYAKNAPEAEDILQDAFVKIFKNLKTFRFESKLDTWMTRIVINLCLDQLRKQSRRKMESIEVMDEESGGVERQMPVVTVNPTERLERAELRQRIDQALSQLSEAHRTVMVLHEFEGMEYKAIAKTMNCSIGTVMSRLFYARRKMATLLQDLKTPE